MLRILGIPTFFLTLSTADLHWPEMVQAVASQYGKRLNHEDVLRMSVKQNVTICIIIQLLVSVCFNIVKKFSHNIS